MVEYILLALLIIFILIAGWYIVAFLLQRKSQVDVKTIFSKIRSWQTELAKRRDNLQNYSANEEEPYGSLAQGLKESYTRLEDQLKEYSAEYGQTQTILRNQSSTNWMNLLRLPVDSIGMRKRISQLNKRNEGFNQSILGFDQHVEKIEQVGWNISLQTRERLEKVQSAIHILNSLKVNYIHGETLEGYLREAKQWEQQIHDTVPVVMLSDTQEAIHKQVSRETIISVFRLLCEIHPLIERNFSQSQDWEQQRSQLELILTKLSDKFRSISTVIEDLEASKEYAIVWDRSRETLFDIRQRLELLGTIQKKRTLEQLENDAKAAQKLEMSLLELDTQCQEVHQQQAELVVLAKNTEIVEGAKWGREAQKLAYKVQAYDPRNWSTDLKLKQISDEIKLLLSYYKNPVWQNANESVKETEIDEILHELQELSRMHLDLRPRVASILARYTEIETLERQAKDNLSRAKALLNQTLSLAGANPVLAGSLPELEKFRNEFDPISNELANNSEGLVEDKSHHVDVLLEQIETSTNRWLQKVKQDLTDKQVELSKKVKKLSEISNLEDPSYVEAARLLDNLPILPKDKEREKDESSRPFTLVKTIREKLADIDRNEEFYPLHEAVGFMKQHNEDWQKCVIALKSLSDIEGPVLEMSTKLEQSRASAKQLLARAGELIPEVRSWPPVNQMLGGERAQMAALDRKNEVLKTESIKAIQIVTRYGNLADEYQALQNKVRQVVDAAEKDQNRIREQETRLEEVKNLWKELRNANPGNARLKEDIQILIQNVDQQMEDIKEKYRLGGLPYNQALQQIRVLYQNLSNTVVYFDDENTVDINGEISRRD